MPTIVTDRLGRILALLMLALTGCAGQLLAAVCDQPLVNFQAGQLTLSSNGCSLQQVLTAVGRKTGIETKLPVSTSTYPVFGNLGPGNPRQVVSALLDGTPFNWSLVTAEDASRSLVEVVLTERIAVLETAKPAVRAATPAANATPSARPQATSMPALQDDPPKRRDEIDADTLSKLPPLPPGVPSSMWQLFPGIVNDIINNGGTVPGGNGQTTPASLPTASNPTTSSLDPSAGQKGCSKCPVPPGVDPNIRNLYPWNLMQLIQSPVTQPVLVQPPPPSWAPRIH